MLDKYTPCGCCNTIYTVTADLIEYTKTIANRYGAILYHSVRTSNLTPVLICGYCRYDYETQFADNLDKLKEMGTGEKPDNSITFPDRSKGFNCKVCKNPYTNVNSNQEDGSYICYNCR